MARPSFLDKHKVLVYSKYKGKCFDCGKILEGYWYKENRIKKPKKTFTIKNANIHHNIPIADGGIHKIENWVLLCIPCHHERHKILLKGKLINENEDSLYSILAR